MRNAVGICALALVLLPAEAARPIAKIDRAKVVGAPVLDEKALPGVYVWLEDGWFNVALLANPKHRITVRASSTKAIDRVEGELAKDRDGRKLVLSGMAGKVPTRSRFKTEGQLTVTADFPIFVGPLSKPAAKTVEIGRY